MDDRRPSTGVAELDRYRIRLTDRLAPVSGSSDPDTTTTVQRVSSLVVIPFRTENVEVVTRNIKHAASHEAVGEVLCVGREANNTHALISEAVPRLSSSTATPVGVVLQDRIGSYRAGKGDGMNTGLRYFMESSHDRIHFYDADITSFDDTWITRTERAANAGPDMVRCYFPRSSTDGMITWMITKPIFAKSFPETPLPRIDQPLGGELLLSRPAAVALGSDSRVLARSDWGIDTAITYTSVDLGFSICEAYISEGKVHKLYGALTDIKTMLIECFEAAKSLSENPVSTGSELVIEPPAPVPDEIAEKAGYDEASTMALILETWTDGQADILSTFPSEIADGMREAHSGAVSFMDVNAWGAVVDHLLTEYRVGDPEWQELLFQLWIVRVLAYSRDIASRGYEEAMEYLRGSIVFYADREVA